MHPEPVLTGQPPATMMGNAETTPILSPYVPTEPQAMERHMPPYPMALKVLSPEVRVWADLFGIREPGAEGEAFLCWETLFRVVPTRGLSMGAGCYDLQRKYFLFIMGLREGNESIVLIHARALSWQVCYW